MKLELKHIACYLPFDLQYKGEYGGVSTMRKLEYCRPYNKETDSFTDEIGVDGYFIQYIKPLLLPISCLTEEIEHNGERFVPIIKIAKMFGIGDIERCEVDGEVQYGWESKGFDDSQGYSFAYHKDGIFGVWPDCVDGEPLYTYCSYSAIQKLAEWHIDFQGLLPAGLAVDKREVKHG